MDDGARREDERARRDRERWQAEAEARQPGGCYTAAYQPPFVERDLLDQQDLSGDGDGEVCPQCCPHAAADATDAQALRIAELLHANEQLTARRAGALDVVERQRAEILALRDEVRTWRAAARANGADAEAERQRRIESDQGRWIPGEVISNLLDHPDASTVAEVAAAMRKAGWMTSDPAAEPTYDLRGATGGPHGAPLPLAHPEAATIDEVAAALTAVHEDASFSVDRSGDHARLIYHHDRTGTASSVTVGSAGPPLWCPECGGNVQYQKAPVCPRCCGVRPGFEPQEGEED